MRIQFRLELTRNENGDQTNENQYQRQCVFFKRRHDSMKTIRNVVVVKQRIMMTFRVFLFVT